MARIFGKKRLEEYRKLRKNTLSKMRRIEKKYGVDVSNEVKLPNPDDFSSVKEYNQWKKENKEFRNRRNLNYQFEKSDFGVPIRKSEIREIEKLTKEAQRLADEHIESVKDKPFVVKGKQYGTVGMRMEQRANESDVTGVYRPTDFNWKNVKTRQEISDRLDKMEKRADPENYHKRNEVMMDNFIRRLYLTFNGEADSLVEKLIELNPDEFYELAITHEEFDFTYYDSEQLTGGRLDEALEKISELHGYLDRYKRGDHDKDFWHKNFR